MISTKELGERTRQRRSHLHKLQLARSLSAGSILRANLKRISLQLLACAFRVYFFQKPGTGDYYTLRHRIMSVPLPAASKAPCRGFASRGFCRFGKRCLYSHDLYWREMRPPPQSTPCFHWEDTGTCPYETRCAYYHKPLTPDRSVLLHDSLLEELYNFSIANLPDSEHPIVLTNLHQIASYDWLVETSPTIGVPGTV